MSLSVRRRITWIAALAVLAMALAPAISQWLLVQRNAGLAWVACFAAFLWVYAPVLTRPRADGQPG